MKSFLRWATLVVILTLSLMAAACATSGPNGMSGSAVQQEQAAATTEDQAEAPSEQTLGDAGAEKVAGPIITLRPVTRAPPRFTPTPEPPTAAPTTVLPGPPPGSDAADAGQSLSQTGTWATKANLPTARSGLVAAVAADASGLKRVYAIGGVLSSSQATDVVEAFNPGNNTWATMAPMPTKRARMAAATGADGKIYVFGGMTVNTPLSTVEAYDPATNTWAAKAAMPTARAYLAAAAANDGKIYVFGGSSSNSGLDTVEAYDPATNTWASLPAMPAPRAGLAATTGCDGLIYLTGGGAQAGDLLTFDPASGAWDTSLPAMAYPLSGHASVTGSDGVIYVFGMSPSTNAVGAAISQSYDPINQTWTDIGPMTGGAGHELAAASLGSYVYALGGYRKFGGTLARNDAYGRLPQNCNGNCDRGTDFENNQLGGWQGKNTGAVGLAAGGPVGSSRYVAAADGAGPSTIDAPANLVNLVKTPTSNCGQLCFAVNLLDDGQSIIIVRPGRPNDPTGGEGAVMDLGAAGPEIDTEAAPSEGTTGEGESEDLVDIQSLGGETIQAGPPSPTFKANFYIYGPGTSYAQFISNVQISEPGGSYPGWHQVCAPINTTTSGSPPSTAQGTWNVYNGTWNSIVTGATAVKLPVDWSNAAVAEKVGYDNICFPCN